MTSARHAFAPDDTQEWWRNAVVYQIYPRSFADSNGDGIGDLAGGRAKLGYLADLGVDAVWLSPFYPSPLADGGYDVADFRDVDPRFGTLADFDDFIAEAHRLGLRVFVDIVPNHTSDQHPWFQEALRSPTGSPARRRYHFQVGEGFDGVLPPSDWMSHFGGSAWEPLKDGSGEWYLHLFAPEQPDLNWDNPEVRQYFLDTLRFWADRGVDGFRIDVAHGVAKDMTRDRHGRLRSQFTLDRNLPDDGTDPLYDRDDVHEIYRTWRDVFNEYDPPRAAVAETAVPSARTYQYARPDELGQVFDFSLLKAPWNRDRVAATITRCLENHRQYAGENGGMTWVLSNHDEPRHASRLALPPDTDTDAWLLTDGLEPPVDSAIGQARARAALLLMLFLPGTAYLYQGEELGLPEVTDLPHESLQDPCWLRTNQTVKGRDGCRVPLPWTTDGPSFGFGTAGAWLPQPRWFSNFAADRQATDPTSMLSLYRRALHLRRTLQTPATALEIVPSAEGTLHLLRRHNGWHCLVNFGSEPTPVPKNVRALLTSEAAQHPETLAGNSALWFRELPASG